MKSHVKTTRSPSINGGLSPSGAEKEPTFSNMPGDGFLAINDCGDGTCLLDIPLDTDVKVAEEQAAMRLTTARTKGFKRVCWKSPDGSIRCLPPL